MGGHEEWRDFLMLLFGECFMASLPEKSHFDMCIVDLMQFMAGMKHSEPGKFFDARDMTGRMVRVVYDYANVDNIASRPIIDKSLVILFDTPQHVPKNKAATQKSRDSPADATSPVVMNEEMYNKLVNDMGLEEDQLVIHYDMAPIPYGVLNPSTIWRSNCLRWQLTSMFATAMLKQVQLPSPKVLIVDDAVVFNGESVYSDLRHSIVRDFSFGEKRSAFEKEVLIAFILNHTLSRRYILFPDGKFARDAPSTIGEADLKMTNYIVPGSDAMKSFLVVSQDTDSIFILLLHMKRLLREGGDAEAVLPEIWLDTQTPSDRNKGVNRAYRFINVKALYYRVIAFFAREFPTISQPIEMLVFLVYALETDFTSRLGHKYLEITRRRVWNLFSELHHIRPTGLGAKDDGYVVFGNKKLERSKNYTCSPKMHNVLGKIVVDGNKTLAPCAIQCIEEYQDEVSCHNIELDLLRCEQFFYFLCQQRLVDDMALVGLHSGTQKPFYADPATLFIHAHDMLERIEKYRERKNASYDSAIKNLIDDVDRDVVIVGTACNSTVRPPSPAKVASRSAVVFRDKSFKPSFSDIGAAISFTPKEKALDAQGMTKLVSRSIPKDYGIPDRQQMKGRLYRLSWILNYLQNATVCRHFSQCYGEASDLDPLLSKYGWKNKILAPGAANVNSSYYAHEFTRVLLGNMPVVTVETEETDAIS